MRIPDPSTFREFVAAVSTAIGSVFATISLFQRVRDIASKVAGVILVAAVALFADQWAVYFAAVFIIATVVAPTGFLERLASRRRRTALA